MGLVWYNRIVKSFVRIIVALLSALVLSGTLGACFDSREAHNPYSTPTTPVTIESNTQSLPSPTAPVTVESRIQVPPSPTAPAGSPALSSITPTSDHSAQRDVAAVATATPPPVLSSGGLVDDAQKPPRARPALTPGAVPTPVHPFDDADLFVHLPPDAAKHQPLRVLVALHGMGGRGDDFARGLIADADRHGWVLVAPTMRYGNWTDLTELTKDDLKYSRMLRDTLSQLPQKLGLKLRQHVLIYGFSRGAQLAHRFALFYPARVETVAAFSAGTYTLPTEKKSKTTEPLPLPYGVGDLQQQIGQSCDWTQLKKISFWLGVGANDNRSDDVPRVFDPYVGRNRVERARAFEEALKALGIDVHLVVFQNADHEITSEMRTSALKFLRDDEIADRLDD